MKKVLTKKQAEEESSKSLFQKGGTFITRNKKRFCTGKYNASIIGRELDSSADIYNAVWAEPHYDKEGKYFVLYCA